MPNILTEQDLMNMPTEQLLALRQQMAKASQPKTFGGRILTGIGQGLKAGLQALPYIAANKIPPSISGEITDREKLQYATQQKAIEQQRELENAKTLAGYKQQLEEKDPLKQAQVSALNRFSPQSQIEAQNRKIDLENLRSDLESQRMQLQAELKGHETNAKIKEIEANIKKIDAERNVLDNATGADIVYRQADTGVELSPIEAISRIQSGDRNVLITQRQQTKYGQRENPLIKSPDLTKDEKDFINLSNQTDKILTNIQNLVIPKLQSGQWGDWQSFQAQNIPFMGIRNQGVQDFKSAVNDLKGRIPFLRGGKQLTPTEARRVDALLNPFGQTPQSYAQNIQKLKDEFLSGKEIMIGGVSAIRNDKSAGVTYMNSQPEQPQGNTAQKKIGRFIIEEQ